MYTMNFKAKYYRNSRYIAILTLELQTCIRSTNFPQKSSIIFTSSSHKRRVCWIACYSI